LNIFLVVNRLFDLSNGVKEKNEGCLRGKLVAAQEAGKTQDFSAD